jgi:signal peptidase I
MMSDALATTTHERRPRTALLLSSMCCGLGQLYCGAGRRGLLFYGASLSLGPLLLMFAALAGSTAGFVLFLATLVAAVGLWVWSTIDASRIARDMAGKPFQPADYNCGSVYGLLILSSLPYALALAVVCRSAVVEAFVIPSASMSPTILPGDRILATKLGVQYRRFERGDVIVFRSPDNRRQQWIKRIVGLPGETVEVREGVPYINGNAALREFTWEGDRSPKEYDVVTGVNWETVEGTRYPVGYDSGTTAPSGAAIKLRSSEYYVLGDNRSHSADSREFGPVAQGDITGLASCVFWPARSWLRWGALPISKAPQASDRTLPAPVTQRGRGSPTDATAR